MKNVVIIIPAYNEELTIKDVLVDFWSYPNKGAYNYKIYVVDNNSSDKTSAIARHTIAQHNINGEVVFVKRQGKSNAVKYVFQKIDADIMNP